MVVLIKILLKTSTYNTKFNTSSNVAVSYLLHKQNVSVKNLQLADSLYKKEWKTRHLNPLNSPQRLITSPPMWHN